MVNNTGRAAPVGALAAADPDDWWRSLETNLRSPRYCSRCSPGEVRTAMAEPALSGGEPSIELFFRQGFASGNDAPAVRTAELVVYLESGAADTLSGRHISGVPVLAGAAGEHAEVRQIPARTRRSKQGGSICFGPASKAGPPATAAAIAARPSREAVV